MIPSLYVDLVDNAISVKSVVKSIGFNSKIGTLLLHLEWFSDVVEIDEKRYDSFLCSAFGLVAASLTCLFFAVSSTDGRAGATMQTARVLDKLSNRGYSSIDPCS